MLLFDSEAAQRSSQEMQRKDDKDEDKGESRGKFTHTLLVRASEWTTVVSSIWVPFLLLDVHLGTSVLSRPWTDVCIYIYIYLFAYV